MPMPTPGDGEEKNEFMDRCMSDDNMQEFDDPGQRRAVCERQWDDGKAQALHYPHIVSYVLNTPWAIRPEMLAVILDLLAFRATGGRLTAEEIQERIGAASKPQGRTRSNMAIIPLFGVISHRMGMMSEMSGGTSTERFTAMFRQALADTNVDAILLDVDSPGGTVQGVEELSAEIYRTRGSKPIVAIANSLAASAAYWIASAADELVVIPSGEVGSIGVLAAHEDLSGMMDKAGVKTSFITAGKYKAEGNPYEALGDEARGSIQARVNEYYDMFVSAVARNRGVSADEVRDGYGEGRVVGAKQAKRLGMVDRIETMGETMERLMSGRSRKGAVALANTDLERKRRLLLGAR